MLLRRKVAILLLIFIVNVNSDEERSFNMFGKLKSSLELAGKFLGLNKASGIANLVSDAFNKHQAKVSPDGNNIFSGFLRILGFDAKKIGAVTVNAIIFVAKLISSTIPLQPPSQLSMARTSTRGSNPLEWILHNTEVSSLLTYSKDRNLPNNIINYIKEKSLDEDSDCVQLLICKTSPFIWGMQKALNGVPKKEGKGIYTLLNYLPSLEEIAEQGDKCEKKHPYCFILL